MRIAAFLALTFASPAAAQSAASGPPPSVHCNFMPLLVFFGQDSSTFDARTLEVLEMARELATTSVCWREGKIVILGHRQAREDPAVSMARAQGVRNYLISKGVPANRFIVEDRGSAEPRRLERGATPEPENGRVEIKAVF